LVDDVLRTYIERKLKKSGDKISLINSLMLAGWEKGAIEEAIASVESGTDKLAKNPSFLLKYQAKKMKVILGFFFILLLSAMLILALKIKDLSIFSGLAVVFLPLFISFPLAAFLVAKYSTPVHPSKEIKSLLIGILWTFLLAILIYGGICISYLFLVLSSI